VLTACGTQPPFGAPGAMPPAAPGISQHNRSATSSYQVLYSFANKRDGANPEASLINVNGTLYGTTSEGGTYGKGTIFSISTTGTERVLYSFKGPDGARPRASLIDINGTFYGTTSGGGAYFGGTVFSINATGTENVLHSFGNHASHDGKYPEASLLDVNGTFYGTTYEGGTGKHCPARLPGCGTVFSVTTNGTEHVLHSFGGPPDGANPSANLIDVKGKLYGTTFEAGAYNGGTVFSITPSGTEKVLHSFDGSGDGGADPAAGLVAVELTLYGTTEYGGAKYNANGGTVFSITRSGKQHVLHILGYPPDGAYPIANLIDVNGMLYGTTYGGGATCTGANCGYGTVFSITTSGTESTLHSFGAGYDGANPSAGLIDVNGTLYGTTRYGGGVNNNGTVFALTP
jgi:uncharacterized repeat protein (TIGR03803 family)